MSDWSLHALFSPGVLLRDSDGDGIADGVAVSLEVAPDLESCAGAIDLAARLGLEVTGITLPLMGGKGEALVRIGPGLPVSGLHQLPEPGCGLVSAGPGRTLTVTGADGAGVLLAARYLAGRYPYLQSVGAGEPVVAEGTTALVIGAGGVVRYLCDGAWVQGGSGAVDLGGGEATGAAPLSSLDQIYRDRDAVTIALSPALTPAERAALVDLAARFGVEATTLRFPVSLLPGEPPGPGPVVRVSPGDGPAAVRLTDGDVTIFGLAALTYLANTSELGRAVREAVGPTPTLAPEEPYAELTYRGEWEVDRFWRLWREQVVPTLERGRPATVDLRVSEPLTVRAAIRTALLAELPSGSAVHVRSCFKQGLHWIAEEVLPALIQAGSVARIELQFRRFTGKEPGALEMPIRWLQECYPADSLLADALGLRPSDVTFAIAETGPTYVLTAWDAAGRAVLTMAHEADTGLRRYLDAFPERGWVHPPTGSLTVNGRPFGPLPTDAEEFWDWYQSVVLPSLKELVTATFGSTPEPGAQPLFGSIHIAASLSEEDRRLGIREEQISPLDALHEDLYFVTLDYMATWGRSLHGQPFGAPGTILPLISARVGGPPGARVTLTKRRPETPVPLPEEVVGLGFGSGGSLSEVTLAAGRVVTTSPPRAIGVDLATPVTDTSMRDVIGPDQLPPLLAYLGSLPGIQVWQAGTSYLGRPCYAIEVRLPVPEQIMPPAKASAHKPMLLINARHHANEVSSTNAVLKLVERAAMGDPEIRRFLRTANIVINPMENMDGAATHYAMMAEHPTWKLHAARFNAVGLEFYGQYVSPETPYTEARVVQDLFRDFRPDVLLDDHGVPSHEWLQPFAGYSSASSFRVSYWLPNALLYGIFRDLDRAKYPHQVTAAEGLRQILTRRVREAPEQFRWNQIWREIYAKWGHAWLPEKFPLELHDGMICYTWPASPSAFSVRFPETCVVDWVTEVPDETAQGEHLRLCAEAHMTAHLACLEFLAAHPQPVQRSAEADGGGVRWRTGRRRPFVTAARD